MELLKKLPNWVVWKFELSKSEKQTKVPYKPQSPRSKARNNAPEDWNTFEVADRVAREEGFDGIGFVLTNSDVGAFDIDHCRDPESGTIDPWTEKLVEQCASYTEITPSGEGLRIIGFCEGPAVHRKLAVPDRDGMSCELYRKATRYITVTGNVLKDFPVVNIDAHIDAIVAELGSAESKSPRKKREETNRTDSKTRRLGIELHGLFSLEGDKPAGYPSRSELFAAAMCLALRKGVDDDDIVAACLDGSYAGKSIFEHVADNGGEAYVKRQIERLSNDIGVGGYGDPADGGKRLFRLEGGDRDKAWRAAERALIDSNCPIYERGGRLVQPLWRWVKSDDGSRETLTAKLVPLNVPRISDIVAHHAVKFQKYSGARKKWIDIDPPKEVMEVLLEAGHWSFPTVSGIVNSPTMRPDGSLLSEPGYDPVTQLWYKPAGDIEEISVSEKPTKSEAEAALKLIDGLLDGFPFEKTVDRSVATAAIFTTVLRGGFRVAPLFFVTAPESGTGKTFLIQLTSTIATGRETIPISGSKNPQEMEKVLSAAAFDATLIINLNNLDSDLDSSLLCQMVTENTVKIRRFGKNDEMMMCDCRGVTVFANGNNIRVVGDLVRRTLPIRLNAERERPETREFEFDPIDRVKARRADYLTAVFTIVRAHMAAGGPRLDGAINVTGFEAWARLVRDPLMWLGLPDPMRSMEEARALDPQREALWDRIDALKKCFGVGRDFTAADVSKKLSESTHSPMGFGTELAWPELVSAFTRDGKVQNAKSIGIQLMADRGRVIDGYSVELAAKNEKSKNTYRLKGAEGDEPPAPDPNAM